MQEGSRGDDATMSPCECRPLTGSQGDPLPQLFFSCLFPPFCLTKAPVFSVQRMLVGEALSGLL